jgi:hypothetical protein
VDPHSNCILNEMVAVAVMVRSHFFIVISLYVGVTQCYWSTWGKHQQYLKWWELVWVWGLVCIILQLGPLPRGRFTPLLVWNSTSLIDHWHHLACTLSVPTFLCYYLCCVTVLFLFVVIVSIHSVQVNKCLLSFFLSPPSASPPCM